MTDVATPHPALGQSQCDCVSSRALLPKEKGLKRHVNTAATSRSLRHLAREAAERGERLVEISRRLQIAPSTIHHWARADGFRRKDIKARASLLAGPVMPGKADYPELKPLAPRARLERLHELSGMARLRAVAAVEEGFVDYGLKWLREAQKLERAWRALRAYLSDYPPPEEMGEAGWRTKALWTLEEWVRADEEGREPVCPWETPRTPAEAEEERRLWDIAEARQPPLPEDAPPEAQVAANLDTLQEVMRLKQEIKKWRLLPGRGDPPFLRAVSRGRSVPEHPPPSGRGAGGEGPQQCRPDAASSAESGLPLTLNPLSPEDGGEGAKSGAPRLYGIEDAFPVRFPARRE